MRLPIPAPLAAAAALLVLAGAAPAARAETIWNEMKKLEKPHEEGLSRLAFDFQLSAGTRRFRSSSPFAGEKTTVEPVLGVDYARFISASFALGAKLLGSGAIDKDEKFYYVALGFAPKVFFLNESPAIPYAGLFVGPAYAAFQNETVGAGGVLRRDFEDDWSVAAGGTVGADVPLSVRFGFHVEYTLLYSPFEEFHLLRHGVLIGFNLFF